MKRHTYLMLSVWVLYSMIVLGGRLRTLRRVSLIRAVVAWSLAVLFQMEMMSSWRWEATSVSSIRWNFELLFLGLTWKRTDTTAPQISSPTMNCSPSMARIRFSQHRDAKPFLRRMIHFPPILLASSWPNRFLSRHFIHWHVRLNASFKGPTSHMGLIPSLKRWKSLCPVRSPGRIMWL